MEPGCEDVVAVDERGRNVAEPEQDTPVELVRMRGVPPAITVGLRGQPRWVYLAPGYFPELPTHPLHRALYGRSSRRDATRGRRCSRLLLARGQVRSTPGPSFAFILRHQDGRELALEVDARTRVNGLKRAGQAYVRAGERIQVLGRRCAGGGYDPTLVVRRLRAWRPAAKP